MQEILKGKKCLLSINIAKVGAVQNAVKIDTHIISPSGVVSCVANGYDELKKVVALIISGDVLNEVGAYSIDLRLVFADSVIIVPTFAFAEVVEGEVPCYGVSEVYVSIEGGEVVPSGSTIVEFVNREEFEQLSSKVEDLEEQIGSGGGGGASDNNYTDADKELVQSIPTLNKNIAKNTADIKTKQDTLTLTTKPNGNIVIGNLAGQSKEFMPATPSGDPMHYAYEAVGAVWNATTGYWELNGVSPIDIAGIYLEKYNACGTSGLATYWRVSTQKTNICNCTWGQTGSLENTFIAASEMEVIKLAKSGIDAVPNNLTNTFRNCRKLKTIITPILAQYANSFPSTFDNCFLLEYIRIESLKSDISFAYSPLLSKESLLFMINNCAENVSFTITLHPDVYDETKDSWNTEIEEAIERASNDKGTTIKLEDA